jgi:hypothetical protein
MRLIDRLLERRTGRALLGGLMLAIAAFSGLMAFGMLQNLWADDADNSRGVYLAVGLPFLAACIAALVSAVGVWRR